jgi:hypothetical protein
MSKQPKLVLAESVANPSAPPANLGAAGRSLWSSIMTEYDICDSGGRALLGEACAAQDRIAECAAIISRDGPVVMTKHGPKDHPLLKHELAHRAFTTRTLQRLGLHVEPVKAIGRPGYGGLGWKP